MKIDIDALRQHGLNRLDIYIGNRLVAKLIHEGRKYVLNYLPDTSRSDFISLSMPVRAESWVSEGRLHPFFEMNLPEGVRREAIAMTFGKAMVAEEMSLLAITGSDAIGRVKIVPEGFAPGWKASLNMNVDQALESESLDRFFVDALNEYSAQGVSGVQPKLLVSDDRMTLKSDRWILKHDGADTPFLSINEFLTTMAAKKCGLTVPDVKLAKDGKSLFVERFDVDCGFEDACSLLGLSPVEKYSGSMERTLKVLNLLVSPAHKSRMKEELLRSVIFNVCIGNADAHLKNFGVLYRQGETWLAPIFDLVSVKAFPEYRHDIPSLTINGKKEWTIGKAFNQFALSAGFSAAMTAKLIQEVAAGVKSCYPEITRMTKESPEFREHAKGMLAVWDTGLRRIHGEKIHDEVTEVLSQEGFSSFKTTKIKEVSPYKGGIMCGR